MSTPENIRYHAAGHISAAKILLDGGNFNGVRAVMETIKTYVNHAKVECPPAIKEMVQICVDEPASCGETLVRLEQMFVDPFNTKIEKAGSGYG